MLALRGKHLHLRDKHDLQHKELNCSCFTHVCTFHNCLHCQNKIRNSVKSFSVTFVWPLMMQYPISLLHWSFCNTLGQVLSLQNPVYNVSCSNGIPSFPILADFPYLFKMSCIMFPNRNCVNLHYKVLILKPKSRKPTKTCSWCQ